MILAIVNLPTCFYASLMQRVHFLRSHCSGLLFTLLTHGAANNLYTCTLEQEEYPGLLISQPLQSIFYISGLKIGYNFVLLFLKQFLVLSNAIIALIGIIALVP